MALRLIRGNFENTHGYLIRNKYWVSSHSKHDKRFYAFSSAHNIKILETVEIPQNLLRDTKFSVALAYTALAGAWELGFTATEIIGIIQREMIEPTYGEILR